MGDTMQGIAVGFFVLEVTGSTAAMGLMMGLSSLPRIFAAPVAGVLIDRGNRKWFLVGADVVAGLAMLVTAWLGREGVLTMPILALAVLVMGTANAFFMPTMTTVIPDLTEDRHLMRVNGVFQAVYSLAGVIGNALGGILYKSIGGIGIFAFNGAAYLFSAGTELFIQIPEREAKKEKPSFRREFGQGFEYLKKDRGLRILTGFGWGVNFFLYVGLTAILPFFQQTPGLGPEKYGYTLALFGLGFVIGSLLMQALRIKRENYHRTYLWLTLFAFLALATMPVFMNITLIYVLILPAAIAIAISGAIGITVNQQMVPAANRGKVMALRQALFAASTPLAMGVSGLAAQWLSPRTVITIAFLCPLLLVPLLFRKAFIHYINGTRTFGFAEEVVA